MVIDIIILVVLVFISCKLISNTMYSNINSCLGVNKRTNRIEMIPYLYLTGGKKKFVECLLEFLANLNPGVIYKMKTHERIIEIINYNSVSLGITILDNKIKAENRVLWEKIFLLNFEDFTNKVQFYEIRIIKNKLK